MRVPDLLPRTAAFRLAFAYAGGFTLAALLLIAFFDWTVADYARRAIDGQLADEMQVLQDTARRIAPGEALEVVQQEEAALGERHYLFLVTAPDGRRLAGSLPLSLARSGPGEWKRPAANASGEAEKIRTLARPLPGGGTVVVGLSTRPYRELRQRLAVASAVSAAAVALLAAGIAWLVGRRLLVRVEGVNQAAARIMEGHIHERLPTIGMGEEFDRLAANLNRMLDRIEGLMEGLRQVSADIAHDLRTPLSRLRRQLEAALLREGENPARDALAHEAVAQVDEILATFNALLRIGQVEGGAVRQAFRRVDLSELLERVRQAYEPLAEDEGKTLRATAAPGLAVHGDEELLTQLLANLIENAMTHAPGPGEIELGLAAVGGGVKLVVADRGPGVPESEREKVLRRFYRLDASRSTPGAGLGLAMVAAVAHLHEARLDLDDNRPGLKVEITFPAVAGVDGAAA